MTRDALHPPSAAAPPPGETRAGRIAKFRRVLPRLVLDRPLHVARTTISVTLAEPIDELCDVTLRLVHESGRTYAETTLTLDPATRVVDVARVVNLPDGRYDVVATPPLAEFFATTPVEMRLPLTVAAATVADGAAAATLAALRAERAAERGDDDTGRGELVALLAALAGRLPLAGRALARLDDPAAAPGLAAELAAVARAGLPPTPAAIADTVATLAALTALGDAATADFAAALLDRLLVLVALAAADGLVTLPGSDPAASVRLDPLAPLTWSLWGIGVADRAAAPVRALTLASGYEPPPFLAALATVAGPEFVGIGLADGATLGLHRDGGALLASRPGQWIAALGADLRLYAEDAGLVGQRDGAVAARYDRPVRLSVPLWAFEAVERAGDPRGGDTLVGRAGRRVVALATDAAFVSPRAGAAAWLDLERPARLGVAVGGDGDAAAALAAARAALAAEPTAVAAPSARPALESAYGRIGQDDDVFRFRFGGFALDLDLDGGGAGS
jgi:hypothetical protein